MRPCQHLHMRFGGRILRRPRSAADRDYQTCFGKRGKCGKLAPCTHRTPCYPSHPLPCCLIIVHFVHSTPLVFATPNLLCVAFGATRQGVVPRRSKFPWVPIQRSAQLGPTSGVRLEPVPPNGRLSNGNQRVRSVLRGLTFPPRRQVRRAHGRFLIAPNVL